VNRKNPVSTMKKLMLLCFLGIGFMMPVNAQSAKSGSKEKMVEISTEYGKMKIKLYNETPKHRDNFIKLVSEGFYNDLIFHRVIKDFMIQGGDPNSKNAAPDAMLGSGDVGYKIPAEINPVLHHKKGVLAAARDNNPEKASSGCQFYIVQGRKSNDAELDAMQARSGIKYTEKQRNDYKTLGGTPHLDGGYTAFGEVVEGLEVIDKIAAVQTKPGDRPVQDVKMQIRVIK
jgi:cyclophilin family peptidyl-prolyl cis-trans isomerase